jgi:DNA helicase II / ATP-dependent DNA helicase PcrA
MTSRLLKPDTPADFRVRALLDAQWPQSFIVVAGAGSGKTTSLVKALHHVVASQGSRLRTHAQKIACITYTDVAAREIHTDVGNDPLVAVSTIHSFLWSVASPFQRDIRQWAMSRVSEEIADLKEKQASYPAGTRQATKDKDAANIEKLLSRQRHLPEVRHFTYGVASDFSKGVLGHEDVIRLATDLIANTDLLPRIVASKHPYIFVDESQDTYQEIVAALKRVVTMNPGRVRVGFFGDPVQQIYLRGIGHIHPEPGWETIKKPENFRSSSRVLEVINAVRSRTDDLIQASGRPSEEQVEGETFFFVLPSSQRCASLEQAIDWLNANGAAGDWRGEGTKILTITHRMAAARLGFGPLFDAFNAHKSETLKAAFTEGAAWPLRPFEDVILPLCDAADVGSPPVIAVLRDHNAAAIANCDTPAYLRLKLSAARDNVTELRQVVETGGAGSVRLALELALRAGFMEPDPRLGSYLGLKIGQSDDIVLSEGAIETLDAFMACDVRELSAYFTYIRGSSPYSTQHGTKGAEFNRVIVILDDTDSRFFQYSYDKILGVKELSATDLQNQSSGSESVIERTWRLLYVCVSRACESLAVMYFGDDVERARQELEDSAITADAPIMTVTDLVK